MSDHEPRADSPVGRRLFRPLFVISTVVLLAAAVGMRPAIESLIKHYSKEPIALRKSLDLFRTTSLPSFREVLGDPGFVPASTEDIGTDDWMEVPVEPKGAVDGLKSNLLLFVTYYSDPRDSIPHTPEVCYRQSGGIVEAIDTVQVATPSLAPDVPEATARILDIDQDGRRMIVMYVICVNGRIYHDRERARLALGMPGDRYTYFSKVEVVAGCPPGSDRDVTAAQAALLLGEAIEVLVRDHYPTREQVEGSDPAPQRRSDGGGKSE